MADVISIQVDASKALSAISDCRAQVEELTAANKQLQASVKAGTVSSEDAANQMEVNNQKINVLNQSIRGYQKEIKNSIKNDAEKAGSLTQLRATLSNLTKQFDELSAVERNGDAGKQLQTQIANTTTQLNEAEQATGRFYRSVGNYATGLRDLKKEYKDTVDQMVSMESQGNANSAQYQELADKAGKLKDRINDVGGQMKFMASKTKMLDTVSSGFQLLAASAEVYQGVLAQVTGDDKAAAEVIKKLQAAMAVANGVQQIANLLQKESALRMAISMRATIANAVAQKAQAVATKIVTAAQWLWNAAMDANPIGAVIAVVTALVAGIYGLVKAIGSVISYFNKNSEAAKADAKATREANAATKQITASTNAAKKSYDDFNKKLEYNVSMMKAQGKSEDDIYNYTLQTINAKIAENAAYEKNTQARIDNLKATGNLNAAQKKELQALQAHNNELANENNALAGKRYDLITDHRIKKQQEETDKAKDNASKAADAYKKAEEEKTRKKEQEAEKRKKIAENEANLSKNLDTQLEEGRLELMQDGLDKELTKVDAKYDKEEQALKDTLSNDKNLTEENREKINERLLQLEQLRERDADKLINDAQKKEQDKNDAAIQAEVEKNDKENQIKSQNDIAQMQLDGASELDVLKAINQQKIDERASLKQKEGESDEEFRQRTITADQAVADSSKSIEEKNNADKQAAQDSLTTNLNSLKDTQIGKSKEFAAAEKAESAIAQGMAAVEAVKAAVEAVGSATKGDPYTIAIRIAAALAAVTVAIAKAKSLGSGFATGGYVSGAGTSTSDSITARLSNGESVMNAKATSMYAPLLSALNQSAGGNSIQVSDAGANTINSNILAESMANAVANIPSPIVTVEDINLGQKRVSVAENNSTL
jgi:hypothetical protein